MVCRRARLALACLFFVPAVPVVVAGCDGGRYGRSGSDRDGGPIVMLMDSGPRGDVGPGVDSGPGVDAGPGGCPGGQTMCGGRCLDTNGDPANCGACGRACPTGASCTAGMCTGGMGCAPAPAGVHAEAAAALQRENEVRTAMGIPCATMVPEINVGAEAHCLYYTTNSGSCVSNPHREVEGCANFYAANFWERMTRGGYGGGPAGEDMHFVGNGAAAVQGWIDSVWHRTPVLSPWIRDIGYGTVGRCDTMDFGRGAPADSNIVATYPYPNQTGVPTSFDGRFEGPNPPAPPTGWPSGYPIHVYIQGDITSHTITRDGDATPIDHVWLAPGTPESLGLLSNEYCAYTYAPLAARTRYRVHVTGSNGAGAVDREWTFTTM